MQVSFCLTPVLQILSKEYSMMLQVVADMNGLIKIVISTTRDGMNTRGSKYECIQEHKALQMNTI